MNEASGLVPRLVRQWAMPATAVDRVMSVPSGFSVCRWRHTTAEIIDATLPANTLVLMRNDARSVRHRGRVREISPGGRGELGLLAAGSDGRWTFDTTKPQEVLHLYLPPEHLAKLAVQAGLAEKVEIREHFHLTDRRLQWLMREIDATLDEAQVSRLYIEGLATAIAARLLSAYSVVSPHLRERGGLAPWQLKRALEAMDTHLETDIGLDMLAGVAGCSPAHFSRAFKQSTGVPPFQWLLQRRIARAQEMLAQADASLANVALAVGFSAQPQFTTAFKRVTGVTPGAWRREHLA